MEHFPQLDFGCPYHIYNRGNGKENVFLEPKNYAYFLGRLYYYIHPVAKIYAFCLLKNHFHLIVEIRTEEEIIKNSATWYAARQEPLKQMKAYHQFSRFFNSYAKSVNNKYGRVGSLFQERFRRTLLDTDDKTRELIAYVHTNAEHHGFVSDFAEWPHCSYNRILDPSVAFVDKSEVLKLYGDLASFKRFHEQFVKASIQSAVLEVAE